MNEGVMSRQGRKGTGKMGQEVKLGDSQGLESSLGAGGTEVLWSRPVQRGRWARAAPHARNPV